MCKWLFTRKLSFATATINEKLSLSLKYNGKKIQGNSAPVWIQISLCICFPRPTNKKARAGVFCCQESLAIADIHRTGEILSRKLNLLSFRSFFRSFWRPRTYRSSVKSKLASYELQLEGSQRKKKKIRHLKSLVQFAHTRFCFYSYNAYVALSSDVYIDRYLLYTV